MRTAPLEAIKLWRPSECCRQVTTRQRAFVAEGASRMPGVFGGIGFRTEVYEALRRAFSRRWGMCECEMTGGGVIGGHAFRPRSAVHRSPSGLRFAVDGEASIYCLARDVALTGRPILFHHSHEFLHLTAACKGNVVAVEPESGAWYLAVEWTGCFPLYYLHQDGKLLFGSLLGPLAHVVNATPDATGILEFLLKGYTIAGRTQFEGIRRILPGQSVRFESGRLRVMETSRLWSNVEDTPVHRRDEIAVVCWENLVRSVRRCVSKAESSAVMMSGGWDSRTLVAALHQYLGPIDLMGYSHGDLQSRELRLAERVCEAVGIDFHAEPLTNDIYQIEALQHSFRRTENIVFPHWHRAGVVLASRGVRRVCAGIFGEVLGGHYGPAMLASGSHKIAAVGTALLRMPVSSRQDMSGELQNAHDFLRVKRARKPWYLKASFWHDHGDILELMNADIETDVCRLEQRGLRTNHRVIEAFIMEHRGAQYISSQLLSCRAHLDIAMPFADRDLLTLASQIPLHAKIHNLLNQSMLRRHAPKLLRFPVAATLLPAGVPVLFQEVSRLIRRLREDLHWRVHFATGRHIAPPRLACVNVEFLRHGDALNLMVDDLQGEMWDKEAIRGLLKDAASRKWRRPMHGLSDAMLRVYTVDLMLRVQMSTTSAGAWRP